MLELVVKESDLDAFVALADAMVGEVRPEDIKDDLPANFPMERLEEYCKLVPSKIPTFRSDVATTVNNAGITASRLFVIINRLLQSRITAPTLTGSMTLVTEMTLEERVSLMNRWKASPIEALRKLHKSFFQATIKTFTTTAGELHNLAMGYPDDEKRASLYENQKIDNFKYKMMDRVTNDSIELHLPNIDAVIIGSGSGSGVVAHTLSNEGYKCLVLEKGKYYTKEEFVFPDAEGMKNLYENQGIVTSASQEIFLLAGATFGGGSTVNWSACIKTPFKVRKEWYDDFGVEFAANEEFDQCLDYVWNKMGAKTIEPEFHSVSNQAIMESAESLGYHAAPVAQNSGDHPNHDCGRCYLGCKYGIKQGSAECWFRDAYENGCQFLDQVRVNKILHKGGRAYGLECFDQVTNKLFVITGPKKFVVSSGSLNTPLVLQASGFKNRHIGKNLKLHPVVTIMGDYGKDVDVNAFNRPIMTAVSNQVADLDGKAHGPRIETILHTPFVEAVYLPFDDPVQVRKDMLKFNHMAAMLIITRDEGSGSVSFDARQPDKVLVDYNVNKFDTKALLTGLLIASDMLYMHGVKEIIHSQSWTPRFKSNKPKHERKITDKDYAEWRKALEKAGHYKFGAVYGSAHQMSSCRMSGKGPKYGAVDLKGKLFECDNVYVADTSTFPTASGANPMITCMAMCRHIALDIVKDLKHKPKF
ncbi:putative long-chain-alcohol oxidase [[Candida] jaroonii]|uniref:Long-chain-alcohol oxidase n=1 Tax=[Candida] jaroonii TaxID=467808 RepID=A0ACA9YDA3_9ASCO|nr:putative long-chain-alcohol oxidase [[Candida] jaroonii]